MVRVIVVDDEPLSRQALVKLLRTYCSSMIEVVAEASSAEEARVLIAEHTPDAVFLDAEMPSESGFSLLESISDRHFHVVIIAADNEYGVSAVKAGVVDYLLKPIDIEELKTASRKLYEVTHKFEESRNASGRRLPVVVEHSDTHGHVSKLAVPNQEGVVMVEIPEILYCKALDSYTHLKMLAQRDIISTRNLKDYEDVLGKVGFARVHKSYLVNIKHVRQFSRNEYGGGIIILADNTSIEVSRRRKNEILELLERFGWGHSLQ